MLVVIEVPDEGWNGPEALVDELRMLQDSHDRVVNDPGYDPYEDEGDETMRLKTDMIVIDVARVVGVIADAVSQDEAMATGIITPLDKA